MFKILLNTVIIYTILTVIMRIMGKRQLGELDVGELVITILLSEIASLPITNPEKSIFDAILPIAALALLEVISSTLILKYPKIKKILASKPAVIIAHGKLDKRAMKKVRISIEDLICQIRQNGIFDLNEVDYAILEENGKMSIIPKSRYRQPDRRDFKMPDDNSGMMHVIISDGVINTHGLAILQKEEKWIMNVLENQNCSLKDVFCMTCNDAGDIYIIKGDGTTLSP